MEAQCSVRTTTETTHLRTIPAALNNLGVDLCNLRRIDEAEGLFQDALRALMQLTSEGNDIIKDNELQDIYGEWQAKLERKRALLLKTCIFNKGTVSCKKGDSTESKSRSSISSQNCCRHTQLSSHDHLETFSDEPFPINMEECLTDEVLSFVVLNNIGLVQRKRGAHETAAKILHMALDVIPEQFETQSFTALVCVTVHYHLALTYHELGRLNEAMEVLTDAIRLCKLALGNHLLLARILSTIGCILVVSGEVEDAVEIYAEASRIVDQHTIDTVASSIQTGGLREGAACAA